MFSSTSLFFSVFSATKQGFFFSHAIHVFVITSGSDPLFSIDTTLVFGLGLMLYTCINCVRYMSLIIEVIFVIYFRNVFVVRFLGIGVYIYL